MEVRRIRDFMSEYELVRVLGEGSFGKVYLVRELISKREYALKKYSRSHLEKTRRQSSLLRSLWILNSLRHHGVARFAKFVLSPQDDVVYLLFEGCKKGSLSQLQPSLRKTLPHTMTLVKNILLQLLEVLQYLQSKAIAHRDIKPSNITFNCEGTLKLIDFDESCCLNEKNMFATETQFIQAVLVPEWGSYSFAKNKVQEHVGTLAYMAPEMKNGLKSDTRGDMWAFGCILYEFISTELFYVDVEDQSMFNEESRVKFQKMKEIDTDSYDLLKKIMVYNPDDRLTLEEAISHNFFNEIREKTKRAQSQKKLKQFLCGNYGLPQCRETKNQAINSQLIGMQTGLQVFQLLKTPVLVLNGEQYTVCWLIGGCTYFKISQCSNEPNKYYVFYDSVESVSVDGEHVRIVSKKVIWNKYSREQTTLLKHIYPEMLTRLVELIRAVLED